MRATLATVKASRLPSAIGECKDSPKVIAVVNEATQRLLNAGGEMGWFGCWQKVAFTVTRTSPYITCPRQFARIINLDVCRHPIRIYNEFYEVIPAGPGLYGVGWQGCNDWCGNVEGFERGNYPTMVDLTATNQIIRVYLTDSRDVGKRVLIQKCLDANGLPIYNQDGLNTVDGEYLVLSTPFTDSVEIITSIGAIQKDVTYGDVVLKQVDATTGVEVTLARYAPDETNPAYRRYYISHLPNGCCPAQSATNVIVTAICKLEYIPVSRDTDQLIIGNVPALIEEAQAIRYSEMDVPNAAALQDRHHKSAIRLLNDELRHYLGEQVPSVGVDIWQEQPLQELRIGNMV